MGINTCEVCEDWVLSQLKTDSRVEFALFSNRLFPSKGLGEHMIDLVIFRFAQPKFAKIAPNKASTG